MKMKKMDCVIQLSLVAILAITAPAISHAAIMIKPISAAASGSFGGRYPSRTVDDSGLSSPIATGDPIPGTYPTHTASSLDHWLVSGTSATITFDLGAEYSLEGMHIWNQNEGVSSTRGIRDADVAFSKESATSGFGSLQSYSGASEFTKASGLPTYMGEDKLFAGSPITARWVRFTISANWVDSFTGICELRFIGTALEPHEVVQPISAAASSYLSGYYPNETRDGSGISDSTVIETGDLVVPGTYPAHNNNAVEAWLAAETNGMWITFDLGSEYLLKGLHLWNSNQSGSTGRGLQNVNIEFSTTSAVAGFGSLESLTFAEGIPLATYIGEDKFFSSLTTAQWVRFSVVSNYGDTSWTGFSEVRFIRGVPPPPSGTIIIVM